MTTVTAQDIVNVVKERGQRKKKVQQFFLDNARRMWGLPNNETEDDSVKVEVTHRHESQAPAPAQLQSTQPTAVERTLTEQPSGLTERPETLVDLDKLFKKSLPYVLTGILTALGIGLPSLYFINQDGSNQQVIEPQTVVQPERPGSLLQYLEDIGAHRP